MTNEVLLDIFYQQDEIILKCAPSPRVSQFSHQQALGASL